MEAQSVSAKEKNSVAMWSVIAALFITGFKLVIGILTGSLGILSEALHSGLDLVAAVITFFSVRMSDRPADRKHPFGHGKVENFSALIETILLLVTCVWIIYEGVHRLIVGNVKVEVTVWSFVVVIFSIIVDFSRSRALYRVAKKHNSQALEADALHFSTDIWSSAVVLVGLICSKFGYYLADSIAALGVAAIVLAVSYRLGKRSVDVLLDTSPDETLKKIDDVMVAIAEVKCYHDVKVRTAGADTFVEMNIHVQPELTIEQAHAISHKVEGLIRSVIDRCEVHVHAEPEE